MEVPTRELWSQAKMNEENYVDGVLAHYGEIALKGDNRGYFEDKLVE
ncbi:MAG: hypothetical protein ACLFVS_04010 [Candidatus Acetothermia bacterium]